MERTKLLVWTQKHKNLANFIHPYNHPTLSHYGIAQFGCDTLSSWKATLSVIITLTNYFVHMDSFNMPTIDLKAIKGQDIEKG